MRFTRSDLRLTPARRATRKRVPGIWLRLPLGVWRRLLHAAGKPYAFVDFRVLPADHWLRRPILSRPLGYGLMLSNWTGNFDAMFHTEVMFPNTIAGGVPDGVRTWKRE